MSQIMSSKKSNTVDKARREKGSGVERLLAPDQNWTDGKQLRKKDCVFTDCFLKLQAPAQLHLAHYHNAPSCTLTRWIAVRCLSRLFRLPNPRSLCEERRVWYCKEVSGPSCRSAECVTAVWTPGCLSIFEAWLEHGRLVGL